MTMAAQTSAQEGELRKLLDKWAEAIAQHQPAKVAALFTTDALFQGFDPTPRFGRVHVEAYYDKQPIGLTASYELLSVRSLSDGIVSAYARVLFHRPDGTVPVYLTVIAERPGESWQISHYHVSKILEG
jgi:uncharacterized protein (TIGR02246 family)